MINFRLPCGLAAALLLLFSCIKAEQSAPEDVVPPVESTRSVTFTCTFGQESKVSVSELGKTRWEPGDKILVHGENRKVVTLKASDISEDGKKAVISVEGITPYERPDRHYISSYYAAYPADAVLDGSLYYYARFNDTSRPLMAAYNDGDKLIFYHLSGLIAFRVSGDFDQCTFTGNDGETVGYSHFQSYLVLKDDNTPRLDWNYASDPGTSGPLTSVTIPVTADGETLNLIALPNGASFPDGFTLTFTKNEVVAATAGTHSSVNVPRGHMAGLGDITGHLHLASSATHCKEEYLGQRPMVIAYLTEYTSASSLDATYVTHINYAHGRFKNPSTGDGGIVIAKTDLLQQVVALKQQKPTLKVLLMIGGWGEKADGFSMMARDAAKRTEFCLSCKSHIDTYGLDGIDIDWEYPGGGPSTNARSDDDAANFNLVLRELRATIGDTKIISFASSSSAKYVDWDGAMQYLDYMNIMTYDMGDPPYHNAGLYKSAKTQRSCDESVALHHDKGIPYDKMVLGLPFYGHGVSPYDDDVKYRDIPAILAATTGDYAGKNIAHWDDEAKVPYLTDGSGTLLLSYDNELSIGLKAEYVKQKGLLGAMFWEYRHDDDARTLTKAVASRLIGAPEPPQEAFLATNSYVQKFLEEVDYGDSEYTYSSIVGYEGGGSSEDNIEIPPTYTISWTAANASQKLRVWEGGWSREYSLSSGTGSQGITNLVPGVTYQWQVTTTSDDKVVASGSFATRGRLHQIFFTPNVRNGRDLGGLKGLDGKTLAFRKLYRGGVISKSYLNSSGKKEMLAEGILAEVDLQEEGSASSSSPLGNDIAFYAPHFDSGYNSMVRDNPEKVKDTFCWVVARLRENKPVYFHCWAGRDRTGTLAVLLEGALGVSESDMAKDYELTYFSPSDWSMYQGSYQHTRDNYSYGSIRTTIFKQTDCGTYQERIVKYLLGIGVPQQDIDDLRSIMLE